MSLTLTEPSLNNFQLNAAKLTYFDTRNIVRQITFKTVLNSKIMLKTDSAGAPERGHAKPIFLKNFSREGHEPFRELK